MAHFDAVRLEGPAEAMLENVNPSVYLRNVKAAQYQLSPEIQPLLVDVEQLAGFPQITVMLDGENILQQQLEKGRYKLEAPMPAVKMR